jgi:hypothetical protein
MGQNSGAGGGDTEVCDLRRVKGGGAAEAAGPQDSRQTPTFCSTDATRFCRASHRLPVGLRRECTGPAPLRLVLSHRRRWQLHGRVDPLLGQSAHRLDRCGTLQGGRAEAQQSGEQPELAAGQWYAPASGAR